MNKFDVSFVTTFEVSDLTLEEVKNLKTQRDSINAILKSYEEKQTELCIKRNKHYIGKYFKEHHEKYTDYYKVLSTNPFDVLTFTLDNSGGFDISSYPNNVYDYEFDDGFFHFDESYNYDLFSSDDMVEITEEEFIAAMDKKYQEFKQELKDIPNIIGVEKIF